MPRSAGTAVSNKFSNGLVTEADGLNFPEDAVTDSLNVKFDPIGFVERRLGIDLEGSADALTYSDSDGVIREFVWTAVAGNGDYTFLVLQVGSTIRFYQVSSDSNVSTHLFPAALNLNDYKAPGAGSLELIPASFASGQGYLYVAHPYCDPIIVRFQDDTTVMEAAKIDVLIRDFQGVDDGLKIEENPADLSKEHNYNLLNQGWDQLVRVGTVSNELGDDSTGNAAPTLPLPWRELE